MLLALHFYVQYRSDTCPSGKMQLPHTQVTTNCQQKCTVSAMLNCYHGEAECVVVRLVNAATQPRQVISHVSATLILDMLCCQVTSNMYV